MSTNLVSILERKMINTKKVTGRREVRYNSMDEMLADAERLATSEVRTLGNWSQGQIYEHVARGLDTSIDGVDFSLPAPVRWMLSLLMKRKFIYDSLPAGFKATGKVVPDETSTELGLESLRKAVERQKNESSRIKHPAFGNITREEWDQFNLRHAELHMSFIVDSSSA